MYFRSSRIEFFETLETAAAALVGTDVAVAAALVSVSSAPRASNLCPLATAAAAAAARFLTRCACGIDAMVKIGTTFEPHQQRFPSLFVIHSVVHWVHFRCASLCTSPFNTLHGSYEVLNHDWPNLSVFFHTQQRH